MKSLNYQPLKKAIDNIYYDGQHRYEFDWMDQGIIRGAINRHIVKLVNTGWLECRPWYLNITRSGLCMK